MSNFENDKIFLNYRKSKFENIWIFLSIGSQSLKTFGFEKKIHQLRSKIECNPIKGANFFFFETWLSLKELLLKCEKP